MKSMGESPKQWASGCMGPSTRKSPCQGVPGRQPLASYLLRGLAIVGSFGTLAWAPWHSSTATSSDIAVVPAAVLLTAVMAVLQFKSWRLCITALALGVLSAQLVVGGNDGGPYAAWNRRCCVFISTGLCLLAVSTGFVLINAMMLSGRGSIGLRTPCFCPCAGSVPGGLHTGSHDRQLLRIAGLLARFTLSAA